MITTTTNAPHLDVATLKGLSPSNFFRTRRGLTISNCCVCGRDLEDAQSVSNCIGPTCSRKYGYAKVVPTPEQLKAALGLLVMQKIATEKTTMAFLLANKGDTRKFANIIVAYCSYLTSNGRDAEVYDYTPALRALGYDLLARQLEISRCKVRFLQQADGTFGMKYPFSSNFRYWELGKYLGRYLRKGRVKGLGRGNGYILNTIEEVLTAQWLLSATFAGERTYLQGQAFPMPAQANITKPQMVLDYEAEEAKKLAARQAQQAAYRAQLAAQQAAQLAARKAAAAPTPAPVITVPNPNLPKLDELGMKADLNAERSAGNIMFYMPAPWKLKHWEERVTFDELLKRIKAAPVKAKWNQRGKNWRVPKANADALAKAVQEVLGYLPSQLGL